MELGDDDVLISVEETSKIMKIAHQTLESGLRDHLFTFGTAIQGKTDRSYRYTIFRQAFLKCCCGEMQPCNTQKNE
jgi:hypothetical protein